MNVLALCTFPGEAAATRFRLLQMVQPLRERGIELTVRPFLDSQTFSTLYQRSHLLKTSAGVASGLLHRLADIPAGRHADVVLVQREAMLFGPPVVERLMTALGSRPLVLDLDDATYVSYVSPTYGRIGTLLKWPGKTRSLIRAAEVVTCGSDEIAEDVRALGGYAVVVPTVVDTDVFAPAARPSHRPPVVGWIGSHSTFPYLESLVPALQAVAGDHDFVLRVIGSGRDHFPVEDLRVECSEWSLAREVVDFQSLDIGLYPILEDRWSRGKAGLKAVQYMSVGIPFVASPVGAVRRIGVDGLTHFSAASADEWVQALKTLLEDADLRARMGRAGRAHALEHYTVSSAADILSQALRGAANHSAESRTPSAPA